MSKIHVSMLRFEWHPGADRGQREVFGAEVLRASSTRMVLAHSATRGSRLLSDRLLCGAQF